MAQEFRIDLLRCEESGVLVATSEDIPGLVLEAETVGGIIDALLECAPRLIEQNLGLPPEENRFAVVAGRSVSMRSAFTMEPQLAKAA